MAEYQFRPVANNMQLAINGDADIILNDYIVSWGSSTSTMAAHIKGNTPNGTAAGTNKVAYTPSFAFTVNQIDTTEFDLLVKDGVFNMSYQQAPVGDTGNPVIVQNFIGCRYAGKDTQGNVGESASLVVYKFVCTEIVEV